jgi:hypothetical protein
MSTTRLSETGNIYVSARAALTYFRFRKGLELEEARRELTELLCDAYRVKGDHDPELWRFRRLSAGVDISARIVRDGGPLAVVTAISVRPYTQRSGASR